MDKYTFTMYHEDGTKVELTGNKVVIDDILDDFRSFLLGCTFSPELVDNIYRNGAYEYNGN